VMVQPELATDHGCNSKATRESSLVSARVVAQLAEREDVLTFTIEFVEQDERAETFRGIMFPPNTANT
jgi:hypothetical protein